MDATTLRQAYHDLLAVANAGSFQPPPPGEWDASYLLAHVASVDAAIIAVALAVVSGQRPAYDNRVSLDPSNLDRLAAADAADTVRKHGELLCTVTEQVSDRDLDVLIPALIVSKDQVVLDQQIPLRMLIQAVADFHLPQHAKQLQSLRARTPDIDTSPHDVGST